MAKNHFDEAMKSFVWKIAGIQSQLELIHGTWAKTIGVTEPQWVILMAIDDLDKGNGVTGTDIAAKIRVHPAFITTQTKSLEKAGLLTRETSPADARYVLMSLTPKARKSIAELKEKRDALNASMFSGLSIEAVRDLDSKLGLIAKNAERAARMLAIGAD
jgi:DNA-binding MarR family transcriptional regulator